MTNKLKKQHTTPSTPLSASVLDRIEKESITPSSWWKFACINCVVWTAWITTVIFGAISVAVLVYVSNRTRFELYEATHETFASFILDTLPFIWMFSFFAMITLAYINMRNTKCGYRYPLWRMLVSSILFSVVGGVVLHVFGVGYYTDTQFAKNMPTYISLERAEESLWQKPEKGRLLGVFGSLSSDDSSPIFIDAKENTWELETGELPQEGVKTLESGQKVRLLGAVSPVGQDVFHVCGVFPWMFNKNLSNHEMSKGRKIFIERMYEHMEKGERLKGLEKEVFKANKAAPFGKKSICAELAMMKRMKF